MCGCFVKVFTTIHYLVYYLCNIVCCSFVLFVVPTLVFICRLFVHEVSVIIFLQGVTIPSQRRYVQYYGHLMRNSLDYSPKTVLLKAIRLEGIPNFHQGGCSKLYFIGFTNFMGVRDECLIHNGTLLCVSH